MSVEASDQNEARMLRAFDAACVAIETHTGAKAGSEWQGKLDRYKRTYAAWRSARRKIMRADAKAGKGAK